eukprot:8015740-Lingulodinium_polyedra.AAC.1
MSTSGRRAPPVGAPSAPALSPTCGAGRAPRLRRPVRLREPPSAACETQLTLSVTWPRLARWGAG